MGVLAGCKPRKEVLHGDLDDTIFAADFGNLIAGKAPKVYQDPKTFFDNTHPAQQLRKVVEVASGGGDLDYGRLDGTLSRAKECCCPGTKAPDAGQFMASSRGRNKKDGY